MKKTLQIASSPHVAGSASVEVIMQHVIIALLPAGLFAIYLFGLDAMATLAAAISACLLCEHALCRLGHKPTAVTDGSVDTTDLDGDLMNTWQEWVADTNPTNALSYFHIDSISKGSPPMISFQSSCNRSYTLWSTPQVASPDWVPVPGEQAIPGNGGTLTLSDPSNAPQRFYRVQVNLP